MRLVGYGPRIAVAAGLVVASVGLAVLAAYLWALGLERANQVSSVVAMFASLLSLVGGAATLLRPGPGAATRLPPARRLRTAWGVLRLDDDVRRLLEATVRMADTAPYSLLGQRHTTLSTVYVRQRLELRREEDPSWELDDPQRDPRPGRGAGVRPIPVSLPLERALGEHRHLLLEGGPGQGKSTTARQLCRQIAQAWLDGGAAPFSSPVLPLLVTARGLAGHRGLPWPQALARAVTEEVGMRLDSALLAERSTRWSQIPNSPPIWSSPRQRRPSWTVAGTRAPLIASNASPKTTTCIRTCVARPCGCWPVGTCRHATWPSVRFGRCFPTPPPTWTTAGGLLRRSPPQQIPCAHLSCRALRDIDAGTTLDDRSRRRLRRSIQAISRGE